MMDRCRIERSHVPTDGHSPIRTAMALPLVVCDKHRTIGEDSCWAVLNNRTPFAAEALRVRIGRPTALSQASRLSGTAEQLASAPF